MQKQFYDRISDPFEKSETKRKALAAGNRLVTRIVYVIYPFLLIVLAVSRDSRFLKTLLVPGIAFVAVTLFRRACNCRRPYEIWDVKPLIPKDTKGHSFPSRHAFSIFMIAMTALWICRPIGMLLLAGGIFLAWTRVALRVHFVRDVLTGAGIAVVVGIVAFFVF